MKQQFDVVVVGAGPAGTTAAYLLAKAGVDVALVERGEYPGSKNMFGGVLYGAVLREIIPSFWEEAPVERYVTRRIITFLSAESSFSLDFKAASFGKPPYNAFTILRPKFDRWYADKAREAGAFLIPETTVEEVIKEGDKVVGVHARREQGALYARVVIAADGVNSLLAQKAGLRGELGAEEAALGVKEVIGLGRKTVEERFGLDGDEGLENIFVGTGLGSVLGGGFLYTNRESVSIGIVCSIASLIEQGVKPYELLERFKRHPSLEPLLRGGTVREYSAHMVPRGSRAKLRRLYTHGMLVAGDAAGLVLTAGVFLEGMNYAMASGRAAAEAAKRALEKGDFSARGLSEYEEILKESFVLEDLRNFRDAPRLLDTPRIQKTYPDLMCSILEDWFAVDGRAKRKLLKVFLERRKEKGLSLWDILLDLNRVGRALIW